jgi:hypothetical protein
MSGNKRYSYRLDEVRQRRLEAVEDEITEESKAAAIDEATKHYLRAKEDLEELADELEQRFQDEADERALGTWELDVEVSVVDE